MPSSCLYAPKPLSASFYLLFCLSMVFTSCSGTREAGHTFEIIVEDGISVAVNGGAPRWQDELFDYELILVLAEDEREESILNRPRDFTMDEDGCFYVADYGNERIAMFDADGRYERSFGRQGQGPGEFESVGAPVVRDGILTSIDFSRGRIVRYQTDGTLQDDFKLPGSEILSNVRGYAELPLGRRLLHKFVTPIWPARGLDAAVNLTVLDAEEDTLWTYTTPKIALFTYENVTVEGDEMQLMTSIPFSPYPDAAFHPDHGLVVSSGTGPELDYLDPLDGTVVRKVRLDIPLDVPTNEEQRFLQDAIRQQIENYDNPLMKGMLEAQSKAFDDLTEAKAAWTNIYIDDSGFLWLRLPDFEDYVEGNNSITYRILSPEGEYLGLTHVPESESFRSPCHGRLLLRRDDPDSGAIQLCVYAIHSRVRGLRYP